jgi:hypothetical protein
MPFTNAAPSAVPAWSYTTKKDDSSLVLGNVDEPERRSARTTFGAIAGPWQMVKQ